jgi:hypothetical protein
MGDILGHAGETAQCARFFAALSLAYAAFFSRA